MTIITVMSYFWVRMLIKVITRISNHFLARGRLGMKYRGRRREHFAEKTFADR